MAGQQNLIKERGATGRGDEPAAPQEQVVIHILVIYQLLQRLGGVKACSGSQRGECRWVGRQQANLAAAMATAKAAASTARTVVWVLWSVGVLHAVLAHLGKQRAQLIDLGNLCSIVSLPVLHFAQAGFERNGLPPWPQHRLRYRAQRPQLHALQDAVHDGARAGRPQCPTAAAHAMRIRNSRIGGSAAQPMSAKRCGARLAIHAPLSVLCSLRLCSI